MFASMHEGSIASTLDGAFLCGKNKPNMVQFLHDDRQLPSQERGEIMTREHMQMSEEAHSLALKLYRYLVYGDSM